MVIDKLAEDQLLHDEIVREIALNRFALDEWKVTTNLIPSTGEISSEDGPDIIATHSNAVVALGEVETEGTICKNRAKQWKEFGDSCVRFYLYVPEGVEDEAVRLIAEHDVHCAGVRTYCISDKLELKPVCVESLPSMEDNHPWWVAVGGGK